MKFKNTLILLAVFGVLFGFIALYERYTKGTRDINEEKGRIVDVDRDKLKSITIKNPETKIDFQKRDNQWFIESPVKDRADSQEMAALFTTLETLHETATVEGDSKDQLKEYGLAEPNTKIILNGDKPVEIDFGKDAAVEGKVYVTVAGSNKVQVISNELKNQISKKTDEFRDRKLSDLTAQQVKKVDIKSAAGNIELEKNNTHWSIAKPLKTRGDDSRINDLVAQAATAHIDQFLTDENLGNYGLAEPRGTVSFTVEGSDKPVVLQIGGSPKDEKEKDKTYVKLSSREGISLVPKTAVENILNAKPNDLRDKNLVRFESDIVDRINIEAPGKEKLVIARKGESWVRKEGDKEIAINEAAAKRLLSDLQGAQVDNFVADNATDLAKYGLDKPQVTVTLSSYASENTAETKAGEKPIVSVLFGTAEGNDCYAKLDDEPFIVATPRAILDSIPTTPAQWQDLTIYKFKPDEITSLEITKPGQPTLALEHDKDKGWKLTKGEGTLNSANVQSLVNALAGLRAFRWIGPATPEQGFDKPTLTLSFVATQGDKKIPGKLTIGTATPDDVWYATAEGFNGTFGISRPDFNELKAPLTDKAAAAELPAPATPGTAPGAGSPVPSAPEPLKIPAPAVPAAPVTPAAPAAPATPTEPATPPTPAVPATPVSPAPATPAAPAPAAPAAPAPAEATPAAPATPEAAPANPAPAAPSAPAATPAAPSEAAPAPAPTAPEAPAAPATGEKPAAGQ